MSIQLTKESDAMICVLYKEYLSWRKSGKLLEKSLCIGDDTYIQERLTPKLPLDDVTELCLSLERKELLYCIPGDNRASCVTFTDDGIIYMENRFKNKLESVLNYLSKITSLLPIPFV